MVRRAEVDETADDVGDLEEGPQLRAWLRSLRGKRLACHCAPLPCHADTYAELADMDEGKLDRLAAMYADAG